MRRLRTARLAAFALLLVVLALSATSGAARTATAQKPKPLFGGTLAAAAGDPGALNPAITSSGQASPDRSSTA